MQVRTEHHTSRALAMGEVFESNGRNLEEGQKRFFKLFEEFNFEGSRDAAQKMTKFANRQTELDQVRMLQLSLYVINSLL
jgi:hypothetical protein